MVLPVPDHERPPADATSEGITTTSEISSHWGTFLIDVVADEIVAARRYPDDSGASPAISNIVGAHNHPSRVARPTVRRRWLDRGPGRDDLRGTPDDEYVELEWDEVLTLLATELERVRTRYGNRGIFGGSYGWGSAGRLHHPQGQLHRFLNSIGGYTRSVGDYSRGASLVLLPHLIGAAATDDLRRRPVSWVQLAEHTDLLVTFGGLRRSNGWVVPGGHNRNVAGSAAEQMAGTTELVNVSPVRTDADHQLGARWLPLRPGTDTAVILAMIHTLVVEDLADDDFLAAYTVGAERVRDAVCGRLDGQVKDAAWAAAISGVGADEIIDLARRCARKRTLINVTYSLQRSADGEQPVWAALTLAAFLGHIGLPGGGFSHGYGSMGDYGTGVEPIALPTFPQGDNSVPDYIPCARITDLLLNSERCIPFNGSTLTMPDVRLVYWAGGNPFHHHQDLTRLRAGFRALDTVVVNEFHWTATAKHADIVLPATMPHERADLAAGAGDTRLRAMKPATSPHGLARDEFWIYDQLAGRLGADFSDGRSSEQWLRHLYENWRETHEGMPSFDQFWSDGGVDLPHRETQHYVFAAFRADPAAHPLDTPSGKIELFSQLIASFHLPTVPGLAVYRANSPDPRHDIQLLCSQPASRLHSQLDMAGASAASKVAGREPIRLHPNDALTRSVRNGDVVRVSNDRGSLLAGVAVTDDIQPGTAQMYTGAWFDPSRPDIATCISGNVNVLTDDIGTSPLAQASTGARTRVRIERHDGEVPVLRTYDPPRLATRIR